MVFQTLFTDAGGTGARVDARPVAAEFLVGSRAAIRRALCAMDSKEIGLAVTAVAARRVLTGRAILAAQVRARESKALIDILLAGGALVVVGTLAEEATDSVDAGSAVSARGLALALVVLNHPPNATESRNQGPDLK